MTELQKTELQKTEPLKIYSIDEVEHITVHGRTNQERTPLTLFWTASGIEINVKASQLWIEVESHYETHEPWIGVIYNGVAISRQMLVEGRYWICLFRNMDADCVKNVKVIKDVQAMSGDMSHCLQIHRIKTDGAFLPVEPAKMKLEFLGDSITSGEGAIGSIIEEDWVSMLFSAVNNYTYMTSKELSADYRVISQSGWGVLSSYDNNPNNTIPSIYSKVCGLAQGEGNIKLGAHKDHDFSTWKPDVIVINLGTNDSGAFSMPPWTCESTGVQFQQRTNDDGSFNREDLERFIDACVQFLFQLRTNNKESYLLWAYGMLGTPLLVAIKEAISRYAKQSKDEKVDFLQLPEMTSSGIGARSHPGVIAHQKAADVLVESIKRLLGTVS